MISSKFFNPFSSAYCFCSFSVASSLFYSNALKASIAGTDFSTGTSYPAYFFTALSVFSLLFIKTNFTRALSRWFLFVLFFCISQAPVLFSSTFIVILYKSLAFLPAFVLTSSPKYFLCVIKGSLISFFSSIFFCLPFVLLGHVGASSHFKFIFYGTFPPRFSGLAIEPAGFAIAFTSVVFLLFLKIYIENPSSFISMKFFVFLMLPYIFSLSSFVVFLFCLSLLPYSLIYLRKSFIYLLTICASLFIVLISFSRLPVSVLERVRYSTEAFQSSSFTLNLFGDGIYSFPGTPFFVSLIPEFGLVGCFFILCFVLFVLNKCSPRLTLYFILSLCLVFCSEAYGSVLVWLPLFYSSFNKPALR